jgi:hypothetical protein
MQEPFPAAAPGVARLPPTPLFGAPAEVGGRAPLGGGGATIQGAAATPRTNADASSGRATRAPAAAAGPGPAEAEGGEGPRGGKV